MEFVHEGKSDDIIPRALGPASLGTDEEDQEFAGGIQRFLIADWANGERMRSEFVDRRNGGGEMLSWCPRSAIRGKNGEVDRLPGHQFGETVSGRKDIR